MSLGIPTPLVLLQPVSPATSTIVKVRSILAYRRSKYQEIVVVDTEDYGRALVLDGLIQSAEADEHYYHEMLVHPAMVAHPNPRRVLILGGGEGATLREVLKHRTVERAVMVDIDQEVVDVCTEFLPSMHAGSWDDPRASVVIEDGKKFVEETREVFDVIIMDLTDPYGPEVSRPLYTREFFSKLAGILSDDGLVVTQAGNAFFFPREYRGVLDSMSSNFPVVVQYQMWIPSFGYAVNYILGSKKYDPRSLQADYVDRVLVERGVRTRYYNGAVHVTVLKMPIQIR